MPSSSAPGSPPSRPVPPAPPAADEDGQDPQAEAPPPPPIGTTPVDAEAEIDASTLRFLASAAHTLYLPWLFRLLVFTSLAKLTRFAGPFCFRWTATGFRYLWTALQFLTVRVVAKCALWLGLAATALWILAGLVGLAAYGALRLRPRWTTFQSERPVAAYVAVRLAAYSTAYISGRFILRIRSTWIPARAFLVIALGIEAWSFLRTRTARPFPVLTSSTSAAKPAPPAADATPPAATATEVAPTENPSDADEAQAERWARQVREEMLRESLLRQGKAKQRRSSRAGPTAAEGDGADGAGMEGSAAVEEEEEGRGADTKEAGDPLAGEGDTTGDTEVTSVEL